MKKLYSLISSYLEEELYWSSLALSEYVYRTDKSVAASMQLLRSMYKLSLHDRCVETIERNPELARVCEIRIIYHKSKSRASNKTRGMELGPVSGEKIESHEPIGIKHRSIELYWEALTKEENKRRDMLVEAYVCDTCNMEALGMLKMEGLISGRELGKLIESCEDKEVAAVYGDVFNPVFEVDFYFLSFYCPWNGLLLAQRYYKDRKGLELFNLGISMYRLYPGSEYSFASLGLYFMLEASFGEARRCFYRAVQINSKFGTGWLYLGIAYAGMKEGENCISCLNVAVKLMMGSFKPAFYLALQYHKMNNFERASHFYKQALRLDPTVQVQERYISLLIYYEYYAEALSYLATQRSPALGLLRVYCNLFLGKVAEAQKHLSSCEADWRYYATAGFIDHLMNKLDSAADNYNKALLRSHVGIVDELLGLAVENITCKQDNNVYDYASDLFNNITSAHSFDVI
jgi:anaphase-promoting complex subunit 6